MTRGDVKGRAAEREVARMCEAWWRRLERGCEFRRTPLSGGWATPTVRAHFRASGDLVTTARRWPFTVEVKRRELWEVKRLFEGKPSPVWGWWRQAVEQAREEGGAPMLWTRKNQQLPGKKAFPWLVMISLAWLVDPERRLPTPDVSWGIGGPVDQGADDGGEPPALYFADRLLAVNPRKFARRI